LSETRIPDLTEILNNHIERDERIAHGDGAVFIAYNDQARVLREIAFKRALIADILAEEHDLDDSEYLGCLAVTQVTPGSPEVVRIVGRACTCGRDESVARRLRLLAAVYEEETDHA